MCHMDNIQQPDLYQNLNIIILYHTCDLHVHSYYLKLYCQFVLEK